MEKSDTVSETITIRKAVVNDLVQIEALIESYVEGGALLPRTFKELADLLDNFFVAEMDERIVGCAALDIYNRKLAEIRSLAVAQDAQGHGVGKMLVTACVELARERQILEVMAISASEDFFKSCGFDFTLPNLRKAFFIQTRDEL
ncbi:MAG: GNAT family N-acetyltransferase [Anaerolineae bacterium]